MHPVDTAFLRRLRARDERAWFELWEAFGPVVRGTLYRWGNGRLGEETLRDLTQDTLAALTDSIERYDPASGTFVPLGTLSTPRGGHTATLPSSPSRW